MSETPYDALIERIRHHCEWAASLAMEPDARRIPTSDGEDYDGYYVRECRSFVALKVNDGKPMLAFAPATEDQLHECEQMLGFSLPPLLRQLYLHVANGGWGPGYGLFGVSGGFPFGYKWSDWVKKGGRIEKKHIRLENYEMITLAQWVAEAYPSSMPEANADQIYLYTFPYGVWPDHLFLLCDWGCGILTYLDVKTEHIFQWAGYDHGYILRYVAASLEEWLERWLAGEGLQFL